MSSTTRLTPFFYRSATCAAIATVPHEFLVEEAGPHAYPTFGEARTAVERAQQTYLAGWNEDTRGDGPIVLWDLALVRFVAAGVPTDDLPIELVLHQGRRSIERGDHEAAVDLIEPNLSRIATAVTTEVLIEILYELVHAHLVLGRNATAFDHLQEASFLIDSGWLGRSIGPDDARWNAG